MGACASKPKELKGEAPEALLEKVAVKDVAVVSAEVDDDDEKRRSLSNLFKENEDVKGVEQVKEEVSETTLASKASEAKPEEVEKVIDAPITSVTERALDVALTTEVAKVEISEKVKPDTTSPAEKEVTSAEEVTAALESPAEKKIEEAAVAIEAPKSETTAVAVAEAEKTVTEENKLS